MTNSHPVRHFLVQAANRFVAPQVDGPPTRLQANLEILFNIVGTHVPSHAFRQAWLRVMGARIGDDVAIFRGTTVLDPHRLRIGDRCNVGWRCVLDARGGLEMGDDVVVASDSRLITADHDPQARNFDTRLAPVTLESRVWLGTGCMVLKGVTVGYGSVLAAGAIATRDVPPLNIVAGVPARKVADRNPEIDYRVAFRPPFY